MSANHVRKSTIWPSLLEPFKSGQIAQPVVDTRGHDTDVCESGFRKFLNVLRFLHRAGNAVPTRVSMSCRTSSGTSPLTTTVIREAYRVLRLGGRIAVSDKETREFLTAGEIDIEAVAPQIDGTFMSAFSRATRC